MSALEALQLLDTIIAQINLSRPQHDKAREAVQVIAVALQNVNAEVTED